MMNEGLYQFIFDEIQGFLPADWEKVVIYLEYGEDSYSIAFYCLSGDKYTKCFDLPGVDENALFSAFSAIDHSVSAERKNIAGQLWTTMTLIVDQSGNLRVDFDYSDFSEDAYEYSKKWKTKYLVV